jgi:HlyD family secretion protein
MKNVIFGLCLLAVIAGLYALNKAARRDDGASMLRVAPAITIDVETSAPGQTEIVRTVQAPGDVEAYDEVDISSELVSKIVEMPVGSGSVVKQGDLLCRLDDAEYRARVLSAEANVARLKAQLRQAEAEFARADRDFRRQMQFAETGTTSAIELADYHTRQIGAEAMQEMRRQELIQAEAGLASAKEDLAKTVISAPISGVVAQLFAQQGEVVVTGTMNNPGTRIMVISDLSRMKVRCRVDEGDAALVQPDQVARIYLQSNTRRSVPGEVLSMATKGTKATGRDVVTFEALVLITADDESVKPGMTANVEIEVDRRTDALTVPVEAVVYRKRRDLPKELVAEHDKRVASDAKAAESVAQYVKLVFCIEQDKCKARLVETGISDALRVEIVNGVAAGDQIVTGPYRSLDQLTDSAIVKVTKKETTTPKEPSKESVAEEDTVQARSDGEK